MSEVFSASKPRDVPLITHIITGLQVGGAERALFSLLANGLEGPFLNHVISLKGAGHYGPMLELLGIPLTVLNMKYSLPSLHSLLLLRAALQTRRPHIIQGWLPHGNLVAWLAKSLLSRESILSWNVRNSLEDIEKLAPITRQIITSSALLPNQPEVTIYNSRRALAQYSKINYKSINSRFIPNGFDLQDWRPDSFDRDNVRSELGLNKSDFVIGFVGRGHSQKNPTNLFDAFLTVSAYSSRARLVSVGRTLDKFCANKHSVIFTGEINNVQRIMRAFDVLCLSSSAEGFPNVIGEAMATGVPCVTTDVGDAREIVGRTGWVVPPSDSDALARALIEALEAPPEELRARGAAARARIEAEFSIASISEKYIALYERLIEDRH